MSDLYQFDPQLTDFIKALGNSKRQQILLEVFADNREHNISEIAERVSIAQSTASEHLSLLKRAGMLESRKCEKEVYYRFNRKRVVAILDQIRSLLSCCLED